MSFLLRSSFRRLVVAVILALAFVAVLGAPASAAVVDQGGDVVTPESATGVISIAFAPSWLQVITLVVSVILPLLVGLVTNRETNPGRKAVYLALLSAVTGFGSELLAAIEAGQTYDAAAGLSNAIIALVISIALHFGIYKPTGVASKLADVGAPSQHRA